MLTQKILKLWTALLRKPVLMCIAIIMGSASVANAITWYPYNGHEYALTENWEPWVTAEQEAVSVGAHLVTINDEAENNWLVSTFQDTYCQGYPGYSMCAAAYIGYFSDDNSTWKWISGEPVTYDNLASPFIMGGTHAYLSVTPHPAVSVWGANPQHTEETSDPSYLLKGIIERPTAVPEPSTLLLLGSGIAGLAGLRRWKGRR